MFADIPNPEGSPPEGTAPPETTEVATDAEEQDTANSEAENEQEDVVDLRLGSALTTMEASQIMGSSVTKVLVIAGAEESGKTTLIASLFHRFQKGPFAGYLFAGSDTLIGFDERCHEARIDSDKCTANMPRTNPKEDRIFLHLKVRDKDMDRPIRDLLISDLSGELYREAKDSVEDCRKLGLIRRADHFILLIDGAKIVRNDKRQSAKVDAEQLLKCCVDAGQLGKNSLVDVLFTKWDIIESTGRQTSHEEFVSQIQRSLKGKFSTRVGRLRFSKVAVLGEVGEHPVGHGLDNLIPSWVEESALDFVSVQYVEEEPLSQTEFDRFLKRRMPHLFGEA